MKKKVLAFVAASMLVSSVGFAAPLNDFSQGKVAVDLTYRNTDSSMSTASFSQDFDKKYNLDLGLTVGLGNNLAFQYKHFDGKSKDTTLPNAKIANAKMNMNEYNVLYGLGNNVAVYAGLATFKGEMNNLTTPSDGGSSDTNNRWQLGVMDTVQLGDKTSAWAKVGVGKDLTSWEVGVGYAIDKNVDFNVDYRSIEAKKLSGERGESDMKLKGLGFGVTYKF